MNLIHFGEREIARVFSIPDQAPGFKPRGLWVSDEAAEQSWSQWCSSEGFRQDRPWLAHEVTLAPRANVLHIAYASDLLSFGQRFQAPDDPAFPSTFRHWRGIDWPRVAKDYQGIIITPYQWSCRLEDQCFWYYGWDCASGCIWDADAIAEIKQVPFERRVREDADQD